MIRSTPQKQLDCPVPQQNCKPEQWTGVPVDTSASYRDTASTYYIFEAVKQINTPSNEWGLSFLSDKKALLTYDDGNHQTLAEMRFLRDNEAVFESGIGVPLEGSIGAISIKNNRAVFSAVLDNNKIGNSDIYTANFNDKILSDTLNLADSLDPDGLWWDSQPVISSDGNVIFYASDRPGGYGGTDIWFCYKHQNGLWSRPFNCGPFINSRCDELTPFITNDSKKLYFSSNGHETIGGYDIFVVNINQKFRDLILNNNLKSIESTESTAGFFSEAENLKPPLNTKADELFPNVFDNETFYYCSNQAAGGQSYVLKKGGFDIFIRRLIKKNKVIATNKPEIAAKELDIAVPSTFEINMPIIAQPTYKIYGTIYNARTKQPVPFAEIAIREIPSGMNSSTYAGKILKDSAKQYEVVELEKDREFEITPRSKDLLYDNFKIKTEKGDTVILAKSDKDGIYKFKLEKDRLFEITAQAPDLFFETFRVSIDGLDTTTVIEHKFYVPEQFTLRINFPNDIYDNPYKYTLDSNGVETNRLWQEEIELLAQNLSYSKIKIEKLVLTGHTDDVGTTEYNYTLGDNRVKFVISELVKRGITNETLQGLSAGKLKPLPRRPKESLELYRKRLRRVELQKILKK